VLTDSDADKHM